MCELEYEKAIEVQNDLIDLIFWNIDNKRLRVNKKTFNMELFVKYQIQPKYYERFINTCKEKEIDILTLNINKGILYIAWV